MEEITNKEEKEILKQKRIDFKTEKNSKYNC
ncbi:unknown [Clostridium sp. CAG:273]|nr:unknown [Clostridium sp. CAG:273]